MPHLFLAGLVLIAIAALYEYVKAKREKNA